MSRAGEMPVGEADTRMTAALDWFVRLRDPSATADDRHAFEVWRRADPANAAAYADAGALWDRFEGAAGQASGRGLRLDRRKLLLGGAALGLAGGGAAFVAARPDLFADDRTGIGERRLVRLPGGGRIELGSDSALSRGHDLDGDRVVLSRGEGFVEAPPGGELAVVAGGIRARFRGGGDVKRLGGDVVIAVESGSARIEATRFAPLTVEAGWQAACRPDVPPLVTRADLDVLTAWRRDRLVFRDTPLPRVAAELDRYRHGRILLLGEGLGVLTVTAAFDTRRTEGAVDALAATLPIRVMRLTPLLTVIRRS